jgi:hypothetical protein
MTQLRGIFGTSLTMPYFSRKFGGNGLGLAICKSIVEKIGGTIHVESDGKNGSLFHFYIPLVQVPYRETRKGSIDLTSMPTLHRRKGIEGIKRALVVEVLWRLMYL